MEAYLPPLWASLAFVVFAALRFDNRHWWEEREAARRAEGAGAWALARYGFADWTFLLGTAFFWGFVLWVGWKLSTIQMLVLFAASWVVGGAWVLVTSWLLRGGTRVLWRPATLAMWPLAAALAWLAAGW